MRVLFLVPYPVEGASYRYRIHQFLPLLEDRNIKYRVRPFIRSKCYKILYKKGHHTQKAIYFILALLGRLRDILTLYRYDIIFVHLESLPFSFPVLEMIAKHLKKKIIYDLDDALYLKPRGTHANIRTILGSHKKIPKIIRLSSKTIVCNTHLKNYASQFTDHKKIQIIPTSVNTDQFYVKSAFLEDIPTIGWIGSHSTYPYLAPLLPIFSELRNNFNFKLKIVGAPQKIELPTIEIIQEDWSLPNEINAFQSLDIGLYPLSNEEWIHGKTGFKPIQYMAVGIPCVASHCGRHTEFMMDGENGFLASTHEEWIIKLTQLLSSKELRIKMGGKGRKTVEESFSLQKWAPEFVELFSA